MLRAVSSSNSYYFGTISGPPQDFDRDGVPDVLVRYFDSITPPVNSFFAVVSGSTGQVVATIPRYTGADGIMVPDLDGDQVPDFWMAETLYSFMTGRADLISGRRLTIVASFFGSYQNERFGILAHHGGDFDGDGTEDLIAGGGGNYPLTATSGPRVFSGRSKQLLARPVPPNLNTDSFGIHFIGVGDLNGDGYDDLMVSDLGRRASATVFDLHCFGGPDGRLLYTLRRPGPYPYNVTGIHVWHVGDLDGDGLSDVGSFGNSELHVFSSRDRVVMWKLYGASGAPTIGDVNGDDFPDFAAIVSSTPPQSVVRLHSGAPDGIGVQGSGCVGSTNAVPRIGATYRPAIGETIRLNLSRTKGNVPAILVLGLSTTRWNQMPLPLDLAFLGMPGCSLLVSPDAFMSLTTEGSGARGRASVQIQIPNDAALRGQTIYAQWLIGDPTSARMGSATRALSVRIL